MSTSFLSETLGAKGVFAFLGELGDSSRTYYFLEEIMTVMDRHGIDQPRATMDDLVASNLLSREGNQLRLTTFGIRSHYLLSALNGADLREIFSRLGALDSTIRPYDLVREGMTKAFLRNVSERPGFSRLYFCSPWVSLDRKQQQRLAAATIYSERRRGTKPEILIITRPSDDVGGRIPDSLQPFRDLGATIYLNGRLHSKLYIREPDESGGYSMAIIGSQNLTQSNWLELGIQINSDGEMINRLIAYFFSVANSSIEVR